MARLTNVLICAARSAWYSTYEPLRLKWERKNKRFHGDYRNPPRYDQLVSIIIPTHNRAELLLTRALPSVLAQTYTNIEVLVCAHGCTDGTIPFMSRALRRNGVPVINDERVRLIEVERRRTYPPTAENHWYAGPVDPINAGLKAARGAWIARIDDDDSWEPRHIER